MVLGAVVFGELLARLICWWRGPLDQLHGRIADGFEFEGIVPAAYALFAAALVLAIGALSRRAALAVLLGVILFLGVRIAVQVELRPHYETAIHATWSGTAGPDLHAAWVLEQNSGFLSASGARVPPSQLDACAVRGPVRKVDPACVLSLGLREVGVATYHPASRFWRFQVTESALYTALAALLIGVAAWRIRRLA